MRQSWNISCKCCCLQMAFWRTLGLNHGVQHEVTLHFSHELWLVLNIFEYKACLWRRGSYCQCSSDAIQLWPCSFQVFIWMQRRMRRLWWMAEDVEHSAERRCDVLRFFSPLRSAPLLSRPFSPPSSLPLGWSDHPEHHFPNYILKPFN